MKSFVVTILAVLVAAAMGNKLRMNSQSFIDEINSKQSSWKAGRNFPEDTPLSYYKALASLQGISKDPNFTLPLRKYEIRDDIPGSFDARDTWPNCGSIRAIRNQGACGSCWAFGAVEVMSDRLCIFSAGAQQFEFSAEELVSCCAECGNGCAGGYLLQSFQYWQNNGIPSGGDEGSNSGCRPYTAASSGQTPACNRQCVGGYERSYQDDLRHGIAAYAITPSQDDMKYEISVNGPIEVMFTVYEDFYNYQGGVYFHTSGNEVGLHAVKVIGFGNQDGMDYWLVANSWGNWGEGGFFKIRRGNNECGIEEYPFAGIPQVL